MNPRSNFLVFLLQALLLLVCVSMANAVDAASKEEVSSWRALGEMERSLFNIRRQITTNSRALQVTGTESATAGDDDAAAAAGDDSAAGDDDDGTSVFPMTDDAYNANNTKTLLPEEKQPATWPATVLIIFLVLAAILLGVTAFKNCRKRSGYQDIPTTNLTV